MFIGVNKYTYIFQHTNKIKQHLSNESNCPETYTFSIHPPTHMLVNCIWHFSPVLPKKASPKAGAFVRGSTLRNMQINHPVITMSLAFRRLICPYFNGNISVVHL